MAVAVHGYSGPRAGGQLVRDVTHNRFRISVVAVRLWGEKVFEADIVFVNYYVGFGCFAVYVFCIFEFVCRSSFNHFIWGVPYVVATRGLVTIASTIEITMKTAALQ